jgi:hypothetical protein
MSLWFGSLRKIPAIPTLKSTKLQAANKAQRTAATGETDTKMSDNVVLIKIRPLFTILGIIEIKAHPLLVGVCEAAVGS